MKLSGAADAELAKVSLSLHRSDPGAQWGASSLFQTPLEKPFPPFLHLFISLSFYPSHFVTNLNVKHVGNSPLRCAELTGEIVSRSFYL